MKKTISLVLSMVLFTLTACETETTDKTESSVKKEMTEFKSDAENKVKKEKKRRRGPSFMEREAEALKEDFIGVRTSKGIQTDLYEIKSTGVSTKPVVDAAKSFLMSLTKEQQDKTTFAVDDIEWRKWLNVDNGIYTRQGVSLKEMSVEQKEKAFGLLSASLSAKGLQQSKDIMKTDQTLKELNNNSDKFDEELYFFTIMGEPSETQPWGWQIDGHHLALNYFVLGDQVVFAPAFIGAEPVFTTSGKYKGNVLLQAEQDLGLALMQSLSPEQQKQALQGDKNREDMVAAGFSDNKVLNYEGIQVNNFNAVQKQALLAVISEYVGNMRDGHAQVKMAEVKEHLDDTYFAWRGEVNDNAVFYYRIHSPVVLIEFDHQGPIGVRSEDGSRSPTRNHIHTMLRTPNGNDYGNDLLKQHLEKHHSDGTAEHSH